MSTSEHGSRRPRARPLSEREQATLKRLELDLDREAALAERKAVRRLGRDLERHDPAFATLLRGHADSPASSSAATATVRAWIWVLSVFGAVTLGMAGVVLVAATLGPAGLAVGGGVLVAGFVALVVVDRLL